MITLFFGDIYKGISVLRIQLVWKTSLWCYRLSGNRDVIPLHLPVCGKKFPIYLCLFWLMLFIRRAKFSSSLHESASGNQGCPRHWDWDIISIPYDESQVLCFDRSAVSKTLERDIRSPTDKPSVDRIKDDCMSAHTVCHTERFLIIHTNELALCKQCDLNINSRTGRFRSRIKKKNTKKDTRLQIHVWASHCLNRFLAKWRWLVLFTDPSTVSVLSLAWGNLKINQTFKS